MGNFQEGLRLYIIVYLKKERVDAREVSYNAWRRLDGFELFKVELKRNKIYPSGNSFCKRDIPNIVIKTDRKTPLVSSCVWQAGARPG